MTKEKVEQVAMIILEVAGTVGAPIILKALNDADKKEVLDRAMTAGEFLLQWLKEMLVGVKANEVIRKQQLDLAMAQVLLRLGIAEEQMEESVKKSTIAVVTTFVGSRLG